ncbi:MAG: protein phosphatase CheZ [Acidobacteriota bacterium]|nr:protein phosphatase CheZ [Acidobacteriota bacterium]
MNTANPLQPSPDEDVRANPRMLLNKIQNFTDQVGDTFNSILEALTRLQDDIKQLEHLKHVADVAEQMLSGETRSHVSIQAKGEVGKLVHAINQTLDNLQQLDKTVHEETGKVPQLAEHLDHITKETETATQQVLEKLDLMIEGTESQDKSLEALKKVSEERLKMDQETKENIENFLAHLESGENQEMVLQEAMDFVALMGQQARVHLAKTEEVNNAITKVSSEAQENMNHAFDIMNVLQFQDITRQKVSKVIGLLKEMQTGLFRLLNIFGIATSGEDRMELTEEQKATQDRILERDALNKDTHVLDVDDIIKNFQNK